MRHRVPASASHAEVYATHKAGPLRPRPKYIVRLTLAQMASGAVCVPLMWVHDWPGAIGFFLVSLLCGALKTAFNQRPKAPPERTLADVIPMHMRKRYVEDVTPTGGQMMDPRAVVPKPYPAGYEPTTPPPPDGYAAGGPVIRTP
jgi:hypothetical protein